MLSALNGADMTCLAVRFQNTCWSHPSNLFVASCFSVLRRYSEFISIKNNPVDLSSLNKSDQLEGLKRTSTLSFSRSFMFSFYGLIHPAFKSLKYLALPEASQHTYFRWLEQLFRVSFYSV